MATLYPRDTLRDRIARNITIDAVKAELRRKFFDYPPVAAYRASDPDLKGLPPAPLVKRSKDGLIGAPDGGLGKVCIIGAGVAGLYTAMILESLDIEYELLEASPDRIGGRIFTKKLQRTDKASGEYDYFDVGAMRFPNIPIMDRTFDLIDRVGLKSKLIPYHLSGINNPMLYNNRRWQNPTQPQPNDADDYFHMSTENGGTVPYDRIAEGVNDCLCRAFGIYKEELAADFDAGFRLLLTEDAYSTRCYLGTRVEPLPYDFNTIQWLETMDTSSGLYDQAFTESVMDSLDFDYPGGSSDWKCIDGGTDQLTEAMKNSLTKGAPEMGKKVIGISAPTVGKDIDPIINVQVQGEAEPRQYFNVISTLPFGCLRSVELSEAGLNYQQSVAMRCLHYDASVKVGILFKEQWWRLKGILRGGAGKTDGPIRQCVYPSYGLHTHPETPGVIIASYTWAQDAQRVGSLAQGKDTPAENQLLALVLKGLATLHDLEYDYLENLVEDSYVHDWYRDEYSMGAFALFGPGQFSNLYPGITTAAAGGHLHFVGEAASCHHAWVVGALNSAWRGVYQMLRTEGLHDKVAELEEKWGTINEVEKESENWKVWFSLTEKERISE